MPPFYKNRIVAVADLVPNARNARTHSAEQVNQIAALITEFGFTNPVLIDETMALLAGHGRVLAAQQLAMEKIPAVVVRGLTEEQKRLLMLADNKVALNAGWDQQLLKLELGELAGLDVDLSLSGFSEDELAGLKIGEDDLMEVGGVGSGPTTPVLKWADVEVPLTEAELAGLNERFKQHYADNGVAFGFVGRLLTVADV